MIGFWKARWSDMRTVSVLDRVDRMRSIEVIARRAPLASVDAEEFVLGRRATPSSQGVCRGELPYQARCSRCLSLGSGPIRPVGGEGRLESLPKGLGSATVRSGVSTGEHRHAVRRVAAWLRSTQSTAPRLASASGWCAGTGPPCSRWSSERTWIFIVVGTNGCCSLAHDVWSRGPARTDTRRSDDDRGRVRAVARRHG